MQLSPIKLSEVLADTPSDGFLEGLSRLYGCDESILIDRARAWNEAVTAFRACHGNGGQPFIIRAPARANFLGRHSDAQGGRSNCTCLPAELIMVAKARRDDALVIRDLQTSLFPPRSFSIGEWMPGEWRGKCWDDYLQHVHPRIVSGDWINYAAGSFLILQCRLPDKRLKGIDAVVSGNIVPAAGLSSSSALSCAGTLAALHVNDVEISAEDAAVLSGHGEHFSGSRGGAGDHAAIMLTPCGKILHARTTPAVDYEFLDFPATCVLVAIYSGLAAVKTTGRAKNLYNERTATYQFAVRLLAQQMDVLPDISVIADLINPDRGLSEKQILTCIRSLPERITRPELRDVCRGEEKWFEQVIAAHEEPEDGYAVRKVCLFGAAEFSRSRMVPGLLRSGSLEELGRLMFISHDGDRVVTFAADGTMCPFDDEASDSYMNGLVAGAASSGRYAVLPYQPGGYPNSCPELDRIVDICKDVDGVYGASLTGAGFGGHVLALVERGHTDELFTALQREYYERNNVEFKAYRCNPVAGASMHPLV